MFPQHCRIKHDPPNSYGDCVRACIATMLSQEMTNVPHFVRDNPDGTVMLSRIRDFLTMFGLVPMISGFPASISLDELLKFMHETNPGISFMLLTGNHAVVCMDGEIVHDPAWVRVAIVPPEDAWHVITLVHDCGMME